MSRGFRAALLLAALLGGALGVLPAGATSYVMLSDAALADQAAVVVQVTVVAREPAPVSGVPATDYFVQVERVVQGFAAGSTLVVRVPGGIGPDGIGLRLAGAPTFRPGERALLFLTPRADGTYAVLHLMLGAFHEVQLGSIRLAVRDLTEAAEASTDPLRGESSAPPESGGARDFEAFVDWLFDRTRGVERPAGYFVELPPRRSSEAPEAAPLEDHCTGLALRRFAADRGRAPVWRVDPAGFDGRGGGAAELARGLEAWRRGGTGAMRIRPADAAHPAAGLALSDGFDGVLFGDPGEEIAGAFSCPSGGVLSVSGVWYDNGRDQECRVVGAGRKGRHGDRQFLQILSADIVINDGSACYFARDPAGTAEVLAHEVGHALGLAHSADRESLMRGEVHGDGRGPALAPSDRAALSRLY